MRPERQNAKGKRRQHCNPESFRGCAFFGVQAWQERHWRLLWSRRDAGRGYNHAHRFTAMTDPMANAENVFAQAVELPMGPARDAFVATRCADDSGLRREVQSLLRAHDEAGDFLRSAPQAEGVKRPQTGLSGQGSSVLNAADCAEAFLGDLAKGIERQVEPYVASLPEAVRGEARQRIEAVLRVRRLCSVQMEPLPAAADDVVPQLAGYHIERKLGEGNLGVVYAARDEKLNRRVAIKVLRRSAQGELRRRALDEARHAAALGHPAVVTIYSVLDEADPPAIVMELVEGYPLDRSAAQLSFEQKAGLLREVARGLAAAHQCGLIHRDLKPDNVIVGPDLRPRILDFGLAVPLEQAGRFRGFEGTPLYASPEQVLGKALTPASDVFSFGGLMFKVLTGRTPFTGETFSQVLEAIATTSPPFLREVAVGVPLDLQAVCLACLAWEAKDRPTASEIAVELGRFLAGEPVRLRPKLYDDLLRRSISEYSNQAQTWRSQSIISSEERDALEIVHRRLLADEDHWIIDARRITPLQTVFSAATWLTVVATVLTVWMLRHELGLPWRWLLPSFFTGVLLLAGHAARREREPLAAATFLAGAALAIAPATLALLAELGVFAGPTADVKQLFPGSFTNLQVLAASLTALVVSTFGLWRLKMTGFAWTTATLAAASYIGFLLLFNWLDRRLEIKALWCLPLAAMEPVALFLERKGRVRWTLPFHLVALVAVVAGLDLIALNGPTLKMLGVDGARWPYFDSTRLDALSIVLNGLFFLALMLITERSASLDLRRAGKLLEVLAILHTLSALFANALAHRSDAYVRVDVWLYLSAAAIFMILAPFRSRWRLLVGGLAGCGLGCYLLVDLGIVSRKPFIISLGFFGLLVALGTFFYARGRARGGVSTQLPRE